jgi:diphosphomevalonate decarboxylase
LDINTFNNFPTSAGLASSASGFAALTKAASALFDLNLSTKQLSQIARLGSGSASRSIFGGFVEWHKGTSDDGSDCFAEQIAESDSFPLSVIIAITSSSIKKISSRVGMKESALTSPYYQSFVQSSDEDITLIKKAILEKDFSLLAEISMRSTVKMHSVMMTTTPPLFYWNSKTFEIIELIRNLHLNNYPVFFTIDAGPQVKIITLKENEDFIVQKINKINQISEIFVTTLGNGAEIIEEKS